MQEQKHKTTKNYLLTNRTQKTPELQGKQWFIIDWKQNKKQDKNKPITNKNQNETNIETERQKHTPSKWKQKQQKKW